MMSDWKNWRWQLSRSVRSSSGLAQILSLTHEEKEGLLQLEKRGGLPLTLTPHFVKLMKLDDPNDPLRLQLIPRAHEFDSFPMDRRDPVGEEDHEVTPRLIHRYPDRVLLIATDRCASYCRFCFRKRLVGQGPSTKQGDIAQALAYIRQNPAIREVILSGGDPFVLSDESLDELLTQIRKIPSVDFIRFHTRMLTFAPMRVTPNLVCILQKHQPAYVVTHFNHIQEIGEDASRAIELLANAGVPVLNQSVLLKGVNDQAPILEALFRRLVCLRVRPYYLHQCDVAPGTTDFRVPIKRALEIVGALRGHISGLCMPTFVIDIPGGYGKVPLVPNPIVDEDESNIYLKGFDQEVGPYPKS